MARLIFAEYRFPKKIVSDVGTNFTAETLKAFFRRRNIPVDHNIIIPLPKQWPAGRT